MKNRKKLIEVEYYKTRGTRHLRRQLLEMPRGGWTLSTVEQVGSGPVSLRDWDGGWQFPSKLYRCREAAEGNLRRNGWLRPGQTHDTFDIAGARAALGISSAELGQILCAQRSTIYRWESAKEGLLKIDPLHRVLVACLCRAAARADANEIGAKLLAAIASGSSTGALTILLQQGSLDSGPSTA